MLHAHLDESQIFRIDHYLGKETVQNLLVFRFANGMFEPVWNRRYIDHVQITAAETVGVERRASYYEGAGALRDMVQNHLMQVLALIAMEPPIAFSAENVRDRKHDVLVVDPADSRGTTATASSARSTRAGWVNGAEVPGYREEEGVEPDVHDRDLRRAAAAARQLALGRRAVLPAHRQAAAEAHDRDRDPVPQAAAAHLQADQPDRRSRSNLLIVNVQPDEGISVRFEAKLPGSRMQLAPVMMNFRYGSAFGTPVPEAYETLLLDAMLGDPTLFARHDFVEASWALITPMHEAWKAAAAREHPDLRGGRMGAAGSRRDDGGRRPPLEDAVNASRVARDRVAT